MTRRQAFWSVLLTGAAANAQAPIINLKEIYAAHGLQLTDDRVNKLTPIIQNRQTQLKALRDFPIDDAISPFHA